MQYIAWGNSASEWALIERWAYSEPCQPSKIENFRKIITAFYYFCKTPHLKSLGWFWTCQVLNMPGFWIFQEHNIPVLSISMVMQGLPVFINMTGFWICIGMQLWKDSEYARFLHMQESCKDLNMAEWCLNKLFWPWHGYGYAWSKFHRVFNMPSVLNMPELRIWHSNEYEWLN